MNTGLAPPKPDFTGNWRFNPRRSTLQIPVPDSSRFEIDHREPRFRLTRTHVYGGVPDTFTVELTTDGQPYSRQFGPIHANLHLAWDGATLFLDSVVRSPDDEGTNQVRYALEDGGRTFVAIERWRSPRHQYDNRWVFDREEDMPGPTGPEGL